MQSGRVSPNAKYSVHNADLAVSANRGPSPVQHLRIDTAMSGEGFEDDDSPVELDNEAEDQFVDSDQLSSSPSVPDEDIDFDNVYALHTFLATVEGQASVSKGDSLELLDDTNSYWWLVRVLKTTAIGYIPAENIETPFERLARLNKHRNLDLTSVTQDDHLNGPGSAAAVRLISPPVHPTKDGKPPRPKQRFNPPGGRNVQFTAPTYYEHSGNEYSDEEEEQYSGDEMDGEHDEHDPDGDVEMQHGHRGSAGFESDDDSDEDESTADAEDEDMTNESVVVSDADDNLLKSKARQQAHQKALQDQTGQVIRSVTPPVGKSVDELLYEQQQQSMYPNQTQNQPKAAPVRPSRSPEPNPPQQTRARSNSTAQPAADSSLYDGTGTTRKITLTPQIAQEQSAASSDSTLVDSSSVQQSQNHVLQPSQRSVSNSSSISQATSTASSISQSLENDLNDGAGSPTQKKDDKKKKGGVFGGLFGRKKDKKDRSPSLDNTGRSSQDSQRGPANGKQHAAPGRPGAFSPAPASNKEKGPAKAREWKDHDSSLAEETARRQQMEAQQAMYNSYGIQRSPNNHADSYGSQNVHTPRQSPANLSPNVGHNASGKVRPGSLLGSPAIPGLDVSTLTVLRVFADETVDVDASFKTVLLSDATTTSDLLKQTLQRFRLPIDGSDQFYLSVKETAGQEELLRDLDKPLQLIQTLSEALASAVLPSVKRSSVSSISSVSSNLSTHPAIERLNMSDFSDDHAVKLFLHRRTPQSTKLSNDELETVSQRSSALTVTPGDFKSATNLRDNMHSPSMRFALRVAIQAIDLPETLAFDPKTQAIVPKTTLAERSTNSSVQYGSNQSVHQRDKLLMFPTNVTVSEVIENALDQFGISDGVVDGGDEVEEKSMKRRSNVRVRYALAVIGPNGRESRLQPGRRIIDVYSQPPLIKSQQTSKDAKRRSVEWSALSPSTSDVQASDPRFILRNAHPHRSSYLETADQVAERDIRPLNPRMVSTETAKSVYSTPSEELPPPDFAGVSPASKQAIIAQQRAASRANQRAMLSAHRNANQGVDIVLDNKATIRSSRSFTAGRVRYSYIDQDGAEVDISDIVEAEWSQAESVATTPRANSRASGRASRSESAASFSDLSYKSAPTSPTSTIIEGVRRSEDDEAVSAVRGALIAIGSRPSSAQALHKDVKTDNDVLQEAIRKSTSKSRNQETLEQRIDRVLSKVKTGAPHDGIASTLRKQTSRQNINSGPEGDSRTQPALNSGRSSPAYPLSSGRRSPAVSQQINRPVVQVDPDHKATVGRTLQHNKDLSNASELSSASTASSNYSPSTPATQNSGPSTSASASPATRATSSMSARMVLPNDFGLDNLLALVGSGTPLPLQPTRLKPGAEQLFGPAEKPIFQNAYHQQVYNSLVAQLASLESRLDVLLGQSNANTDLALA